MSYHGLDELAPNIEEHKNVVLRVRAKGIGKTLFNGPCPSCEHRLEKMTGARSCSPVRVKNCHSHEGAPEGTVHADVICHITERAAKCFSYVQV